MIDSKHNPYQIHSNTSILKNAHFSSEQSHHIRDIKPSQRQVFEEGLTHFLLGQYKMAFQLFKKTADDSYLPAHLFLGVMYQKGRGVHKNVEQAKSHFRKVKTNLAWFQPESKTDPFLLYCLGELSFYDKDRHSSLRPAAEYFQIAAQLGCVSAQYKLGLCYHLGQHGVEKSSLKTIEYLKLADKNGMAAATGALGRHYFMGRGVIRDEVKAVAYFQQAAQQGDLKAHYNLGKCSLRGIGLPKDAKIAISYFQKAMEQGDALATHDLGCCYLRGLGITKNATLALDYFQKAADQGLSTAQYHLGHCYLRAEGVAKDESQAVFWFGRSAARGHALGADYFKAFVGIDFAQYAARQEGIAAALQESAIFATKNTNMPYLEKTVMEYLDPTETVEAMRNVEDARLDAKKVSFFGFTIGGIKEKSRIANLFRLQADQGQIEAQFQLGKCYESGLGVTKDKEEAVKFYVRAAKKGHQQAKKALENLPVELAQWYQLVAQLGYAAEQFELGRCYELGRGVKMNRKLAAYWYGKAASKSHQGAQASFQRFGHGSAHGLENPVQQDNQEKILTKSNQSPKISFM